MFQIYLVYAITFTILIILNLKKKIKFSENAAYEKNYFDYVVFMFLLLLNSHYHL